MEANVPLTPKRVRREIAKVLPGFVSHTKFFSSFAGGFTPVAVNAAEKRRLVSKIAQIKGQPEKDVRAVVRDWKESAIVREVRTYGNGETFVRFEVRIRFTEGGPLESEPHMLMLALSPRGQGASLHDRLRDGMQPRRRQDRDDPASGVGPNIRQFRRPAEIHRDDESG